MEKTVVSLTTKMVSETEKIIVGKTHQIRLMIMALLAEGHILLDDLPGVGKTTLAKTLSIVLGCDSKRVQFVPDLLPSDILGMNIFNRKTGEFQMIQGPVMTHILLADEINRAIPRTQSALLEAMEEKQVTIDGETYPLPSPFMVLATQNPVESESTFRLPAAQMDRFMVQLSLGYPDAGEESRILKTLGDRIPFDTVETVTSAGEILSLQKQAQAVQAADSVTDYIVRLTQATRGSSFLKLGASPRGSRALYKGAKAWAAMAGRTYVTPDDVQDIFFPVMGHRLMLSNEARLAGKTADELLSDILENVQAPPAKEDIFNGRR